MTVLNYQEAADQIGTCPECGHDEFKVQKADYILPSMPPQYPFWLICRQCDWKSEQFQLQDTAVPEITVKGKRS